MKEKLKNKKVIVVSSTLLIMTIIVLLTITIKDSYAYYGTSNELEIMKATIGNFAGDGELVNDGPIEKSTDVNVIFYAQTPNSKNKYVETKEIPITNYVINEEVSNCYPKDNIEGTEYNSYTINSEGLIDIEVKENKPNQIVCRIYYDYENKNNLDVIVYAYLQDEKGTKKYNNNNYKIINTIPDNVTFIGFTCNNKDIKTNITYEENILDIKSSGPNICQAYFRKNS